jgi:hypothetical protein
VRCDATELPGIRPTLGHLDLSRKSSPEEVGALILKKLGRFIADGGELHG